MGCRLLELFISYKFDVLVVFLFISQNVPFESIYHGAIFNLAMCES